MSNLVQASTGLPSVQEFNTLKELGAMAIRSGFLPQGVRTAEQAIIIMLKGREIGIPPMQAFSSIAVISGKPTMSAELMLSMIYRNVPGAIVNYLETTNEKCVIEAKRPGGKATRFSFTMEDARRANLAGKGPWLTYPSALLRARTVSAMARAMFPDALSGIVYTPEELGADVDDSGEILSVPSFEVGEPQQAEPSAKIVTAELFPETDPENYVATFGKYKGMAIGALDVPDLANYIAWLETGAREQGKPIRGEVAEFIRQASLLVEQRQARYNNETAS